MIKIENFEVVGWEHAIRGMRNPMNSWEKSDSAYTINSDYIVLGPNDHELMMKLAKAGPVHGKYRRMIDVYVDITAPLYWWKEFDTYKVGTVANSCSTMHKIHAKEFTMEDFSHEHLFDSPVDMDNDMRKGLDIEEKYKLEGYVLSHNDDCGYLAIDDGVCVDYYSPKNILEIFVIGALNANREAYLKTKDKKYWWQMIQLLPSSYNQLRTVKMNYEVLANIYEYRKNHKLDEWVEFCKWIERLPYSEIITCSAKEEK